MREQQVRIKLAKWITQLDAQFTPRELLDAVILVVKTAMLSGSPGWEALCCRYGHGQKTSFYCRVFFDDLRERTAEAQDLLGMLAQELFPNGEEVLLVLLDQMESDDDNQDSQR